VVQQTRRGPSTYDFNGLTYQWKGLSHVYSVGSIPTLAARYPSKALTFGETPETIENNPVFLFSNDTLYVLGEASLVPQKRFRHNRPYEPMAVFPVTYQTVRKYSHMHYDTVYNANGTVAWTDAFTGSDSMTVDGYGTLKVLGRQFECLRVKLSHYTFSDKEFMYFTREGVFIDIQVASTRRDTGSVQPKSIMLLVPSTVVSADQPLLTPSKFALEQNYPNPFNPTTAISYKLSALSDVKLTVTNSLGQDVVTLVDGMQLAGTHIVRWDAAGQPSGVYFYRLRVRQTNGGQAGDFTETKRMMLLR